MHGTKLIQQGNFSRCLEAQDTDLYGKLIQQGSFSRF